MLVVGGALVVRRLLISGLAAFAIGLGAAPIASADPPQDYLDTLSNTPGFTVTDSLAPYSLERGTQSARTCGPG
jgi:hypothetical protein